ncbi:hypothetical protein LTR01_009205, partial [Friedmanniomyces endolithicus]
MKGTPFFDYDWLLSQNHDLIRLVSEQRESSQHQTVIFNDVLQKLGETTQTKDRIEWQRQALWSDNIRLKGEVAQMQHALAVDRFQHAEDRKNALLRDQLGNSLRQEAFLQRDFMRLTTEHLAQNPRIDSRSTSSRNRSSQASPRFESRSTTQGVSAASRRFAEKIGLVTAAASNKLAISGPSTDSACPTIS